MTGPTLGTHNVTVCIPFSGEIQIFYFSNTSYVHLIFDDRLNPLHHGGHQCCTHFPERCFCFRDHFFSAALWRACAALPFSVDMVLDEITFAFISLRKHEPMELFSQDDGGCCCS